MDALIFGGQSPRHEQWIAAVADVLRPHFNSVKTLQYDHWQTGSPDIDLEHEIVRASAIAKDTDQYIVIAKSIGTVVASLAIARGLLTPERCVYLGFPLAAIEGKLPEVAKALIQLPRITFVHNEFDTVGSAAAVQAYLDEAVSSDYDFRTIIGNMTHDYLDFGLIASLAIKS